MDLRGVKIVVVDEVRLRLQTSHYVGKASHSHVVSLGLGDSLPQRTSVGSVWVTVGLQAVPE